MKKIVPFLFLLFIFACQDSPSVAESDLHYLNGYWEISEVEFPDGSLKEYGLNSNIDFIQLEDGKGFRKKLQANLGGTYDTSNHDVEQLTVSPSNDIFIMSYDNEFSQWQEKLVHLDSFSFSVVNNEGVTYNYKRFEPIKIPQ
ncbi:hypothetical protein [Flagellimonas zhangzhouensis]|uniref:Lipocalin-like domain-containing protein n=1 Tax=Flagellimonas zhangzhouensis TaxID=1073328 RepID=A0A1H2R591_9FLAO|nr:hypothetical protein [Allomuricauda zhangzhouensis]SDQ59693.1 hypothetical protein SAMN05216294_1834 [Allomuricauda zhangzhouensis]SDW14368.1 hypothetical protein SAMN04487892_0485 [Allomuricauda zhangzhouensis]